MLFNHGLRAALVVRYCKVCYYLMLIRPFCLYEVISEHVCKHRDGEHIVHERSECYIQNVVSANSTLLNLFLFYALQL